LLTNFHSLLRLIAGIFVIADRMFWAPQVAHQDEEALLFKMQAAVTLYRSVDEEVLKGVIRETFSPSFPTSIDEAHATGERLTILVQERCHAARSQQASH